MNNATLAPDTGRDHPGSDKRHDEPEQVNVVCDYLSADDVIERIFPANTELRRVKEWAREVFVPNPPSDKAFFLSDDKTRHRFTESEEQKTLAQLGYSHQAHLRLHEEQVAGLDAI